MMRSTPLEEARGQRDRPAAAEQARPRRAVPLRVIEPIGWQGQPIPERRWIVQGLIPVGAVTMLGGDGGLGKSLLGMQLTTAAAVGRPWLGMQTLEAKAVGIHCEDTEEELHARQADINRLYEVEFGDLDRLKLVSRVGEDNTLMEVDKFNRPTGNGTIFYGQILDLARSFGAQLVLLDSLHDLFAGNENSRPEARQFVNLLRRIALEIDGAVVLLSHPSMAGLNSGSGTSGSTAWNAAVRSRLYLTRPKGEEGEDGDPNVRLLRTMKSNYGETGGIIPLRWRDGVFVRDDPPTGTVANIERRAVEVVFLECMAVALEQGRPATDARNSPRFAPKMFAAMPQGQGYRAKEFERAMNTLLNAGRIKKGAVPGPDRHTMPALVEVAP